uniref:hypothetical protein n=1 Tax=Arthrobacter sp. G119Y2 TaxID=3134965 RepID=UPI0031199ED5
MSWGSGWIKAGSATVPVPGFSLAILDGEGTEVPAGEEGNIVLRLPLPPGQIADGDAYTVPSTIEDPAVIEALVPLLRPGS